MYDCVRTETGQYHNRLMCTAMPLEEANATQAVLSIREDDAVRESEDV